MVGLLRCGAGLLDAPVGGGPPASRPRRELRSARRLEARPGPATAHGRRSLAPPRSPPVPSGPSGALHTGGGWGADVWLYASARSPARPCRCPWAPQPGPRCSLWALRGPRTLRFLADLLRVVTNVVNRRCFLCGFPIRCYKRCQSDGFFAENSGFWMQIDDVCNGYCPWVPRPGRTTARGRRGQALSRSWCWGLRCCAGGTASTRAKKFALLDLMVGVSAREFALRAQNGPNSAFLCLLGEFFRGNAGGGAVLGEFFRGNWCCARFCTRCGALQAGCDGGFASCGAF